MRINDKENYYMVRDNISMKNLKKIIDNKNYSVVKVASNCYISEATINAYISGQKIPSVPTLINIANYLNTNIDFLLDRTNNPMSINDMNEKSEGTDLDYTISVIKSLPKNQQEKIIAFVKGITAMNR